MHESRGRQKCYETIIWIWHSWCTHEYPTAVVTCNLLALAIIAILSGVRWTLKSSFSLHFPDDQEYWTHLKWFFSICVFHFSTRKRVYLAYVFRRIAIHHNMELKFLNLKHKADWVNWKLFKNFNLKASTSWHTCCNKTIASKHTHTSLLHTHTTYTYSITNWESCIQMSETLGTISHSNDCKKKGKI